jgi:hypothetical protein
VLAGLQTDVGQLVQEMDTGVVDFGGQPEEEDCDCGGGGGGDRGGFAGGGGGGNLELYLNRLGMPLLREASSLMASFAAPSAPPLAGLEEAAQQHFAGLGAGRAGVAAAAEAPWAGPCPRQQLPPGWLTSEEQVAGARGAVKVPEPPRVQQLSGKPPLSLAQGGGGSTAAQQGRPHSTQVLQCVAEEGVWGSAGGATGSDGGRGQQQQQQQQQQQHQQQQQQQADRPDGLGPLASARQRRRWVEQATAPSAPLEEAACSLAAAASRPSSGKCAPSDAAAACGGAPGAPAGAERIHGGAALQGGSAIAGSAFVGSAFGSSAFAGPAGQLSCGGASGVEGRSAVDPKFYELPPLEEDGPGVSDCGGLQGCTAAAAAAAPSVPPAPAALAGAGTVAAAAAGTGALTGAAAVAAAVANARSWRQGGPREAEQQPPPPSVEPSRGRTLSRQSTAAGLDGPERSVGFWGAAIRGISPEKRRRSAACGAAAPAAAAAASSAAPAAAASEALLGAPVASAGGGAGAAATAGGAAAVAAAVAAATGRSPAKGWRRLFGVGGPESPPRAACPESAAAPEEEQAQGVAQPASPCGGAQPQAGTPGTPAGCQAEAAATPRAQRSLAALALPSAGGAPAPRAGSPAASAAAEAEPDPELASSPLRAHARRLPLPGRDGCFAGGAGSPTRRSPSPDKKAVVAGYGADDVAGSGDTAAQEGGAAAKAAAAPAGKQAAATAAAAAARLRLAQRAPPGGASSSDGGADDIAAVGEGGRSAAALTHSQRLSEAGRLESEAKAAADRGRLGDAEQLSRQALALLQAAAGAKHPNTVACMGRLASFLSRQGKGAEAEGLFRQVLQHREALLGRQHPQVRRWQEEGGGVGSCDKV